MYLLGGVYLPRGVYLTRGVPAGGVPAQGGTCPGTSPCEQNDRQVQKILPCPKLHLRVGKNNHPLCFSGVFRPPADGVYVLTFYGLTAGTNSGNIYIKQNDDRLCRGYLRSE